MKALRFLASRWVLSFVGVAIVALLVWFFGPLLAWLEGWVARLVIVLVLLIVWAAANLTLDLFRRRREQRLEKGVTETTANAEEQGGSEEAAALRERMSTALGLLKKVRGTRGYLYEQPWYVIIGPPGAGKTTALLNSGLKFPLAAEMGQGAVAGVGGTRLCDWWFTENAVLIDTAGRYTTQDSNAAVDRAGWDAFLEMLHRTRPRQPLNGVIVAIALSDVAAAPKNEQIAHARAVRRRIKELEERLNIRLPVYLMLTKSDLIAGFAEFFDDLDRERREQVWGVTFPFGKGATATPVAQFPDELQLLVDRLNDRLFDRLQAEQSPDRRALIAGFPTQIASLAQPLQGFLTEAFGGSKLDPAPLLRGVYFASGTQEGSPIDRLTGVMMRAFGLDQRRAAALRPVQGRSYFLGQLVSRVIFGEAMLVSEPPSAHLRRLILRSASYAVVALLTLGVAGWLVLNKSASEREIGEMSAALDTYERIAKDTTFDPVNDADLPRLLPLLDAARDLANATKAGTPLLAGFDLSQTAKLRSGAAGVYRHALGYALLPRLVWRLEAQMRGYFTQPDFLYEATRVYLMLGGQGPLDRALVKEWMTYDWQAQYSGPANIAVVADLQRHLDALLAEPLPAVGLDDSLVAKARTTFSRVSLASRAYSRIKPSAAAQSLPPWRPSEALGRAGGSVFTRASGKKLSDGIPGFLTVDGFHKVLLPALSTATREVASESWVLGQKVPGNLDLAQQSEVANDVVKQYLEDYAKAWDGLLQDLEIAPLRSLNQASQDLYILASKQSPLKELLTAIARQLTLSEPPKSSTVEAVAAEAEKAAKDKAASVSPTVAKSTALASLLAGQAGSKQLHGNLEAVLVAPAPRDVEPVLEVARLRVGAREIGDQRGLGGRGREEAGAEDRIEQMHARGDGFGDARGRAHDLGREIHELGVRLEEREELHARRQRFEKAVEAHEAGVGLRGARERLDDARRQFPQQFARARRARAAIAPGMPAAHRRGDGRTFAEAEAGEGRERARIVLEPREHERAGAGLARRVLEQAAIMRGDRLEHAAQPCAECLAVREAHEGREPFPLVRVLGQRLGLLVGDHLQAVLDRAQEGVGGFEIGDRLGRSTSRGGERLQRRDRRGHAQFRIAPAPDQLLGLRVEFDLADAAAPDLHVVAVQRDLPAAAMRLDLALDRVDVGDGREIEMPAPHEGPQGREELLARLPVACHRARLDHRGAFPVLADALVIGLGRERGERHGRGRRIGAQAQVGAEHVAVLVARFHDPDEVAHELDEDRLQIVRIGAAHALGVVEDDEVDVGGIVEFARPQLAHAEHDEPRALLGCGLVGKDQAVAPRRLAQQVAAGEVEGGLGRARDRGRHLRHVPQARYVGQRDRQRRALFHLAQALHQGEGLDRPAELLARLGERRLEALVRALAQQARGIFRIAQHERREVRGIAEDRAEGGGGGLAGREFPGE